MNHAPSVELHTLYFSEQLGSQRSFVWNFYSTEKKAGMNPANKETLCSWETNATGRETKQVMIFKLYFYSCSAERCKQALTSEHSSENKQRITFILQTAAAGHKSINKYESKLCFEHFSYLTCSCVQSKYV